MEFRQHIFKGCCDSNSNAYNIYLINSLKSNKTTLLSLLYIFVKGYFEGFQEINAKIVIYLKYSYNSIFQKLATC